MDEARARRGWGALAAILGLAVLLRLLGLTAQGMWFDELWTWRQMQLAWGALLQDMIHEDVHPPLYPFLLAAWTRLWGGSDALVLRSLSALLGVLTVGVVYCLGRDLWDPRTGRWAALFLAVNVYAIFYSQEARSYSLLLLVSATTLWTWWRLRAPHRWWHAAAYVLSGAALAYTHVFGVLLLIYLAGAYGVLAWRGWSGAWRWPAWLGQHVLMGLLFVPWLPALWLQTTRVQEGFWIPKPTLGFLLDYFSSYSGSKWMAWWVLALVLWALWKRWRGPAPEVQGEREVGPLAAPLSARGLLLFWLALALFMLLVPFVVSQISQPMMHAKSAIVVLVSMALLVARGLETLPRRALVATWVVGALLGVGTLYFAHYRAHYKENWREMSGAVAAHFEPGRDLAVLYHPDFDYGFCYHYYLPAEVETRTLICAGAACEAPILALKAEVDARGIERLWLMRMRSSHDYPAALASSWEVVASQNYHNGVMDLLERRRRE